MSTYKEIVPIANMIKNKILKYELLIILIVGLSLLMKYFHIPLSGVIGTLSLSTVATIYFFSAFSTNEADELITAFDIFIYKICAFGSSVSMIGTLFALQHWPGFTNMLFIGLASLSVSIIYVLIQKSKRTEVKLFNKQLLIRIFVLVVVSAVLLYFTL